MITAINFNKALQAIPSAEQQAKIEIPNAVFVFLGADNEKIYFNLVAKKHQVTEQQMKDVKEKTRFFLIKESQEPIYKAEFSMSL